MANFKGAKQTASLIFVVVVVRCCCSWIGAVVGAASGQQTSSPGLFPLKEANQLNASSSGGQKQQQQQPLPIEAAQQTACDSLFIASEKLAKYCLCTDQVLDFEPPPPSPSSIEQQQQRRPNDSRWPLVLQISELSCQPNDLATMGEHLGSLLGEPRAAGGANETATSLTFRIDYLNINTNISAVAQRPTSSIVDDFRRIRLQIDHISLQLAMHWQPQPPPVDESPPFKRQQQQQQQQQRARSQAESQMSPPPPLATVEDQMIDFCGLINETHLQFLSIFIIQLEEQEESSLQASHHHQQQQQQSLDSLDQDQSGQQQRIQFIRLTRLLAKFSSLNRLELNFQLPGPSLRLETEIFRQQKQLKWLNLGSNKGLKLPEEDKQKPSPFFWASQLEYLSLESCELDRFAMFSFFSIPFKLALNSPIQSTSNDTDSRASVAGSTQSVFGLPNLTTLNLAANRLKSLDRDLFFALFGDNSGSITQPMGTICQEPNYHHQMRVFVLPSLTQLDLSENQLEEITFKAGQYILCTMPNLNQLYLRRNKIKHLNLNSLLVYPTLSPHLVQDLDINQKASKMKQERSRFSRLEHLDLSHNNLVQISALVPILAHESSNTRIKSINLSQNKLRALINFVNSTLIDRIIFQESFHYDNLNYSMLRLDHLERSFRLFGPEKWSICDLLSPRRTKTLTKFNLIDESLVNEVILTDNRLTKISGDDFLSRQCKDIQILRLSGNNIRSISDKAFASLVSLEQLDLSSNSLVHLEESTFITTIKLRILNLARNRIKTLHRGLFFQLPELEELFLNENELTEIPHELFTKTSSLNVLDLSNNRITYLDDSALSSLNQLRILNLNGNQLKSANYLLFKHADNGIIKTITTVMPQPRKTADKTSTKHKQQANGGKLTNQGEATRRMKLRRNRQTNIEGANNMVALAGNQLESFNHAIALDSCDNQTFALNVLILWLNSNNLRELSRDSFKCLPSVQRLYLQSNRLRSLDESTFDLLTQLEFVDLSKNQLAKLHLPRAFPQRASLKYLDISSNQLFSLILSMGDTEANQAEPHQLELLNASENPNLSIDSADLVEFLLKSTSLKAIQFKGIKQIRTSGAEAKSKQQAAIRDKLLLDLVDLSGSSIETQPLLELLASDQIGLDSLNFSRTMEATKSGNNRAALQQLIASRLQLDLVHLDLSANQLDNEHLKLILNPANKAAALQRLNLSSNMLDYWPLTEGMARNFGDLKSLDLSGNRMRHLISKNNESSSSYSLAQLEEMDLSWNGMVGLIAQPPPAQTMGQRSGLAQLMPKLKRIDLSHNRLSWLPMQLFEGLTEINSLRLDHNQIETFPSNLLHLSSNRIKLNLDHNKNIRLLTGEPMASSGPAERWLAHEHDSIELVLFADQHDHHHHQQQQQQQLRCLQVDEFVGESIRQQQQQQQGRPPFDNRDLHVMPAQDNDSANDGDESDNEQCQRLITLTRSISFNSIGPNASANLNSLLVYSGAAAAADTSAGQQSSFVMYDLSLRGNDLRSIGDGARGIIKLDLSDNRIGELPAKLSSWPDLMSLDLSRNQLQKFNLEWIVFHPNSRLTYLDLSHNRISALSLASPSTGMEMGHQRARSSLLVLKLNNNNLSNLDGIPSYLMDGLRLLDVRFNSLKSPAVGHLMQLERPLLTVITSAEEQNQPSTELARPHIKLTENSIQFEWSDEGHSTRDKYSLRANSNRAEVVLTEEKADQVIKFCRLHGTNSSANLRQICLHRTDASQSTLEANNLDTDRCLYLMLPAKTQPCSIDISRMKPTAPSTASNRSLEQFETQLDGHHLAQNGLVTKIAPQSPDGKSTSPSDDDVVLNFIDSLKKNWLRLKEVNMNEYLAGNLNADSVWVELGDKYQIHSLTVIKVAIVTGSMCIIGLLVAIFILLTSYFSNSKVCPYLSDSGSNSELTTVTNQDSTSSSSSSNECSNKSIETGSRTRQPSLQSASDGTTQLNETVLDRATNQRSFNSSDQATIQLQLQQQQQQPQLCLTPCSSLAPSSIETAETMQAVDSIQSGTPNNMATTVRGGPSSIDQYSSNADNPQNLYQQQQLATVMRMVKSNSANFECGPSKQRIPAPIGGQYGTMNSRHANSQNYSTLRTRMRQFYSQQQQQQQRTQIPLQAHSYCGGSAGQPADDGSYSAAMDSNSMRSGDHQHGISTDPTTMSLLSLSSALSGGNNFGAQPASPATNDQFALADQETGAPNTISYQQNLCHYHSKIMQHQSMADSSAPMASLQHQPDVIFEQEEDQSYNPGSDLHLSVHNLPPPPPSPRAVEALEMYDARANNFYPNHNH